MLILFDIDATLITTGRAGVAAMGAAGRSLFGEDFCENRVEYAGRLDPLIIRDLLTVHEKPVNDAAEAVFKAAYREHLIRLLGVEPTPSTVCPGVPALLEKLFEMENLTIGLLTGNYPDTGRIKLEAAGIDVDWFRVCAWGCDSPHDPPAREHLPAVAMERYLEHHGRPIAGESVTVIGDTPHDISCARAHGCRVLAVATGMFSTDDLSGADRAVEDLSKTGDIVSWLTTPALTTS